MAQLISMRLLGISGNLANLFPRHLPLLAFGTAIGSGLFHNLLYWGLGITPVSALFSDIFAMAMGDFVGSLLLVVFVMGVLRLYRLKR